MKVGLIGLAIVILLPVLASAQTLSGRLEVGEQLFAVRGEMKLDGRGAAKLSLELSRPDGVIEHSLTVVTGRDRAEAVMDRWPFSLPNSMVWAWASQLTLGRDAGALRRDFDCHTDPQLRTSCDSRQLVSLGTGLPGRLRLAYNAEKRLVGVRFFSLAEWNNRFSAYVSLSLDVQ